MPSSRGSPPTLEKVCVDTVESGFMTKDLALLIGPEQKWLTTEGFLDKVSLHELMANSDYIVVQLPLNDSTRGIIDRKALEIVKPARSSSTPRARISWTVTRLSMR